MAENSAIEWTDTTWNPVTGCTNISAGCDNCYAARFSERFRGVPGHPFQTGFDLTLRSERLTQPLEWKRPRMIFVNSISDLFHKDIPKKHIAAVFDTVERPTGTSIRCSQSAVRFCRGSSTSGIRHVRHQRICGLACRWKTSRPPRGLRI
jgi:protein gp37